MRAWDWNRKKKNGKKKKINSNKSVIRLTIIFKRNGTTKKRKIYSNKMCLCFVGDTRKAIWFVVLDFLLIAHFMIEIISFWGREETRKNKSNKILLMWFYLKHFDIISLFSVNLRHRRELQKLSETFSFHPSNQSIDNGMYSINFMVIVSIFSVILLKSLVALAFCSRVSLCKFSFCFLLFFFLFIHFHTNFYSFLSLCRVVLKYTKRFQQRILSDIVSIE